MEETQNGGFKTGLFGFKKQDVLAYIDTLSAARLTQETQAQEREQQLRDALEAMNADKQKLLEKARQVSEKLHEQEELARKTAEKAQELNEQLSRAQQQTNNYKLRLLDQEQSLSRMRQEKDALYAQVGQLRSENQRLQGQNTTATRQAEEMVEKVRDEAKESIARAQSQAYAQEKIAQAKMTASAQELSGSVAILREKLDGVDEKIAQAAHDLEYATAAIHAALDGTAQQLNELSEQMSAFPQPMKKAEPAPEPEAPPAPKPAAAPLPHRQSRPVSQPRPARATLSGNLLRALSHMLGED